MQCPRRTEIGNTSIFNLPKEDTWREDNTCSYCGSLHPVALFREIETSTKITPTDKNYKIYVRNKKFYFQHFNEEDKIKFIELLNKKKINFDIPGYFYVLPFFIGKKS